MMLKTEDKNKVLSDIHTAKLETLNDINKRFDEKLQFTFNVFKMAAWSLGIWVTLVVAVVGVLGYRSYKDIQKKVEAITKENADNIIQSDAFKKRIDASLGAVVEDKINSIENVSKRIDELKVLLGDLETQKVVKNLFSTIDPRIARLENLEKHSQVIVTESGTEFINDGMKVLSIQTGSKNLTKNDITDLPSRLNYDNGNTRMILFPKPFLAIPKVFAQLELPYDKDHVRPPSINITSISPTKEGFKVTFSPSSRTNMIVYNIDNIKITWIALGK